MNGSASTSPRAVLDGDGAEARRVLLDGGLYLGPGRKSRELLNILLLGTRSPGRVTAISRIGWHGSALVLPDASFGAAGGEELLLQGSGAVERTSRQRDTLHRWQEQLAQYAVGNSRLALAISAAFAVPLVRLCDAESGGIHLRGASATGKSTALLVAGSVWGGGEPGGYVKSWRATANGLEGVALGHCDALACLDEIAQVPAREAGKVAYRCRMKEALRRPRGKALVAETLALRILGGEYEPGKLLPNEAKLLSEFGVSRTCLQEALRMLGPRAWCGRDRSSARLCATRMTGIFWAPTCFAGASGWPA